MNPVFNKIFESKIVSPVIMIDIYEMKKQFKWILDKNRKHFKNISIYFETLSNENRIKVGYPDDGLLNVRCLDGFQLYNIEKSFRESEGFIYSMPKDVVFEGIQLKMYIINGHKGFDYNDHLGLVTDYIQAPHELVCYMMRC